MTDLPDGWEWSTLGELCEVVGGGTPRTDVPGYWEGDIPWVTPDDLAHRRQKRIARGKRNITRAGLRSSSARMIPRDSVLFSSRAPIGYVAVADQDLCTNQGFKSVIPPRGVSSDYLYWYLQYATGKIQRIASGTTFKEISKHGMKSVPIPVAPTAEQERIVLAIEEYSSRLDAADSALSRVLRQTSLLRGRVLDRVWLEGWAKTPLSELLAEPLANGRSVRSLQGGFPVLRLTAIRDRKIRLSERKEGEWTEAEAKPFLVQYDDFFVSRGNGSLALVGRGGLVEEQPEPVAFPDTMIRIRVNTDLYDTRLLALVWDSGGVRRQIESMARTTAGIYKINQRILENILIPFPPPERQRLIVESLLASLDAAANAEPLARYAQERGKTLRRSLLASAFSGRLVAQDPADEPATRLIERIVTERTAEPVTC